MDITNDQQAAELLSKSLSGELNAREERLLREYTAADESSHRYAALSAAIDRAAQAAGQAEADSQPTALPGLSPLAKERMRRTIREAQQASSGGALGDHQQAMRVAEESDTAYFTSAQEPAHEVRKASSRFTLLQKIGEGGLGTVWLARDELLGRNVALKEMNAKAATSRKLWKRFEREAKITGHLEHPNVVPLYLSGINPDSGLPFYVMRFLGKQTLSEAIREYHAKLAAGVYQPLDLHRLLDVFQKVCQAIAFAHSRGVIHRDLKPDNVVLDSFGQVVVLDWGLAKLEGDSELAIRLSLSGKADVESLGSTLDGDVVGTPLYMAPEQAAGELEKVDTRTDVYGLGAILFAILTGNAPHEQSHKSTDGSLRVREFLQCIASSEAPSPRSVSVDIPRDLDAICTRAMARERFARHSSAMDLSADVERWIAGHHEKEARYDAMRLTGRDLKSRLCVQLRQLIATAQFVVELPPVQGLLESVKCPDVDFATWRERLISILLALAKSKPSVSGFSFAQFHQERIEEMVRIERSMQDVSNIRSVPQSRLRHGVANTFHRITMEQFPGEAHIDFDCTTAGSVRIVCGIPVFDLKTEEPFGLVAAEAEIANLVLPELQLEDSVGRLYLIDDSGTILFSDSGDARVKALPAAEILTEWPAIQHRLTDAKEYIDSGRSTYATKLTFPHKNNSITIVFHDE